MITDHVIPIELIRLFILRNGVRVAPQYGVHGRLVLAIHLFPRFPVVRSRNRPVSRRVGKEIVVDVVSIHCERTTRNAGEFRNTRRTSC